MRKRIANQTSDLALRPRTSDFRPKTAALAVSAFSIERSKGLKAKV
jgi:hypothetical protein